MKVKISEKTSEKSCLGWDLNNGSKSPAGEEGKQHSNKEKILCAKTAGTRELAGWRAFVMMEWDGDGGRLVGGGGGG